MRFKKIIKITLFVIVSVVMALLTYFNYIVPNVFGSPHLVGGSIDSMEIAVEIPMFYAISFLILFFCFAFWYFKTSRKVALYLLIACFCVWMLSGRIVSILVWPETKVYSGWFDFPNQEIELCKGNEDCETLVLYHTKVEKLSFWRLRVKNKNVDEVIFVGPMLWSRATSLFAKSDIGLYNKK